MANTFKLRNGFINLETLNKYITKKYTKLCPF